MRNRASFRSMGAAEEIKIPTFCDLPESDQTPTTELLLAICHQLCQQVELLEQKVIQRDNQLGLQAEQLGLQAEQLGLQSEQLGLQSEQLQQLKDEIAILKGEKARPKIKPSTLNKDKNDESGGGSGKKKRKRGKPLRKKTAKLKIHDEVIIHPKNIPPGSVFKGYEDYVVQDIEIKPKNTKYRQACYDTPEGGRLVGELPKCIKGTHFGPQLRCFILSQYHEQDVTEGLLLNQLREFGIQISSGQLSRLITEKHEDFHNEKDEILRTGLEVSSYVNVDDTGARHQGKNGVCTHIGNEFFAWFSSTESKSRINFLELLRAGSKDYVIDEVARQYMAGQKLPKAEQSLLTEDKVFSGEASWKNYLKTLGIKGKRHIKIITEGALVASIVSQGIFPELVIMSDDAGQFNILGFLNALCWVHAERTINKIIPYSDSNRETLKLVQDKIWDFYQKLKEFKVDPTISQKIILENEFDQIFTQKTSFQTLNLALGRLNDNKKELLLVLERSEVPLHNNLSENDIRQYVKKRKISSTTRSENGRQSRDTFLSLKKTCKKLKISFWQYLLDRISCENKIPFLPQLIRQAARAP